MRNLLFLLVIAGYGCSRSATPRYTPPSDVTPARRSTETELAAAIIQANQSLDSFIARLKHPKPQDQAFFVKARLSTTAGDDESVWIATRTFDEGSFEGVVDSQPAKIEDLKAGDRIAVLRDKIIDWKIISDDMVEGAYTEAVWQRAMSAPKAKDIGDQIFAKSPGSL